MASLLEIVEMLNGDIVLQRDEDASEPLVTIKFSDEALQYVGESRLELARSMIQAGIEFIAESQMQEIEQGSRQFEEEGLLDSDPDATGMDDNEASNISVTSRTASDRAKDTAEKEEKPELTLEPKQDEADNSNIVSSRIGAKASRAKADDDFDGVKASDLSASRVLH